MPRIEGTAAPLLLVAFAVACGGSTAVDAGASSSASSSSSGSGLTCGDPGYKGNELGVGATCTGTPAGEPRPGECGSASKWQCVGGDGNPRGFCSLYGCTQDAECGSRAHCVTNEGSTCVPDCAK